MVRGIAPHRSRARTSAIQPDDDETRVAAEGVVRRLEMRDAGRVARDRSAQKTRSTNLPRRAARSSGRPSAAFAVIVGARSPTFSSRNGKTSSGMAPMSSGSSLRPPGISGTTTSARAKACRPARSPCDPPFERQLQDVSPRGARPRPGTCRRGGGPRRTAARGSRSRRGPRASWRRRPTSPVAAPASSRGSRPASAAPAARSTGCRRGRGRSRPARCPPGTASRPTTGRPVPPIWTRTVSPGFTSTFTGLEAVQPRWSASST